MGKCQRTTDTRFMKRSRLSTSSELQYLLATYPRMKRAEITARISRRSRALSRVVYFALHEFFGGNDREYTLGTIGRASGSAVDTTPLQPFALRDHLLKRANKTFHLGFLSDGKAHVVWKSWEQPADVYLALFHCLDQWHDRAFAIDHDEVGL